MQSAAEQASRASARKVNWLSRGFEALIAANTLRDDAEFDFDVVIVGSGYGGAVALSRLAGCADTDGRPLRLCLLERGNEYLPGAFPSRFAQLPGHVRVSANGAGPRGARDGLFDVRSSADVNCLVANGLGGGSLINAGVMAKPHEAVFQDSRWPMQVRDHAAAILARADRIAHELGAAPFQHDLAKHAFMQDLAGANDCLAPPITVASRAGPNAQGVHMHACLRCGDCATGCNHGAKLSLDTTLLADARRRHAVEIYTGATVLKVTPRQNGWSVATVYTDLRLRRREDTILNLRAHRVVLAAGTFGSSEILLRSAQSTLEVSPLLGCRFSTNGDSLSAIYDARIESHSAADESQAYDKRNAGPTITRCIDARRGDPAVDMVVQDVSVPGPLRRAFEEIVLTTNALHQLGDADTQTYPAPAGSSDTLAVDPARIERTQLVATIGHDSADGRLFLPPAESDGGDNDGCTTVVWPQLRHDRRFAQRQRALEALANPPGGGGTGGRVLANPVWQPLPQSVAGVISAPPGSLASVHPLGGCAMGENWNDGVVDHCGRVFKAPGQLHDGLVVLDGSIVPTSLGINPALTIATLADRAIEALIAEWNYVRSDKTLAAAVPLPWPRPVYRPAPAPVALQPTKVRVMEQLYGLLTLDLGEGAKKYRVKVELCSKPVALTDLTAATELRTIDFDPKRSSLQIFRPSAGSGHQVMAEVDRVHGVPLQGTLNLFAHSPSGPLKRRLRALAAWLRNRGVRDLARYLLDKLASRSDEDENAPTALQRVTMAWRLASRAGDVRLLDYTLATVPQADTLAQLRGALIGRKSIGYSYAANPWTQLQHVQLLSFPGWQAGARPNEHLQVDLTYFEKSKSLLLEIDEQTDMPAALTDLAGFGLYLLRLLIGIHLWTFRLPDQPAQRLPRRLPGQLDGLPPPQIIELVVDAAPNPQAMPVLARLTRYGKPDSGVDALPPVLLIHGYSASGTTFAHPAIVDGGLAGHLARRGRDVWVLDLRSSAGMPTARDPWTFEQIGYADIPLAVERVLLATGMPKLDIVAHCMGAAMLSMALFGRYAARADADDPQLPLRILLPQRIRRLVLSQVGPRLQMSPANVSRAYLLRYLQHFLPLETYQFRSQGERSAGVDLLDRFLTSVPYDDKDDFRRENPLWPPGAILRWTGTRHRMDALYGVTFKLANMPPAVLDCIDDFFGPLNVRTATQVIHFTRTAQIADASGAGRFCDAATVQERLLFPMLTLHSAQNGLVDVSTCEQMRSFADLRDDFAHRHEILDGMGHQDSLIGSRAGQTFELIRQFLEKDHA